MPDRDCLKEAAAQAAMAYLPAGGVVGLGTGTTARHALRLIGQRISAERLSLVGVASSRAAAEAAAAAGIPLLAEEGPWEIAVTFDGADEVSPALDLIKGGGGALLREKIVNGASALNVIMVDEGKLSDRLGQQFPLPVEIARFGWAETRREVEGLAGAAVLRERDGAPFMTDNGNYILDLTTGPIDDPPALDRSLLQVPGVMATGLFIQRTDVLVIARPGGVEIRRKENLGP